jgi:hypothetical protein
MNDVADTTAGAMVRTKDAAGAEAMIPTRVWTCDGVSGRVRMAHPLTS